MIDLAQLVLDDVQALTAGTDFATEDGDGSGISYHLLALPDSGEPEGRAPVCVVLPRVAGLLPARSCTVDLQYMLYSHERAGGVVALDTLVGLLTPLGRRGRDYSPWKLDTVELTQGDPADGLQPHPVYLFKITMHFSGGPALPFCS